MNKIHRKGHDIEVMFSSGAKRRYLDSISSPLVPMDVRFKEYFSKDKYFPLNSNTFNKRSLLKNILLLFFALLYPIMQFVYRSSIEKALRYSVKYIYRTRFGKLIKYLFPFIPRLIFLIKQSKNLEINSPTHILTTTKKKFFRKLKSAVLNTGWYIYPYLRPFFKRPISLLKEYLNKIEQKKLIKQRISRIK